MGTSGNQFNTSRLLEYKLPAVLEEEESVWNSMRKILTSEVLSWNTQISHLKNFIVAFEPRECYLFWGFGLFVWGFFVWLVVFFSIQGSRNMKKLNDSSKVSYQMCHNTETNSDFVYHKVARCSLNHSSALRWKEGARLFCIEQIPMQEWDCEMNFWKGCRDHSKKDLKSCHACCESSQETNIEIQEATKSGNFIKIFYSK